MPYKLRITTAQILTYARGLLFSLRMYWALAFKFLGFGYSEIVMSNIQDYEFVRMSVVLRSVFVGKRISHA